MQSKKVILSLHYLPSVLYFKYLLAADEIWFETSENYTKQSYRNRCKILSANGILDITIPVIKQHNKKQLVKNILLDENSNWRQNHFYALQSAYGNSAYWPYYNDYFKKHYSKKNAQSLFDFNLLLLKTILKILKVEKQIFFTESYNSIHEDKLDLRNYFDSKGRNADEQKETESLKKYLQVFSEKFPFKTNLSIIDLLMNCGTNSLDYIK